MKLRAIAFGLAASLAACNPTPEHAFNATSSPNPSTSPGVPRVQFTVVGTAKKRLVTTMTRNNRVKVKIVALREEGSDANGVSRGTFHTVGATFYDQHANTLTARSPQAYVDQGDPRKTITMFDDVHATSGRHVLSCNRLVYSEADDTIHGDGDVVVTGPDGMRLTGNHFDSDIALTNIRMR